MEEKLREYAKLLVEIGIGLQKGQNLVISAPVECAHFARLCAHCAYENGAREVIMNWSDDLLSREKYLYADASVFDSVPAWRAAFYNDYAEEGANYLAISASDPETLRGVDPDRLLRAQQSSAKALDPFYRRQMQNGFAWCIASVPIPSWAKKVFPDCEEAAATARLWDAIFEAVRITGDGSAVDAWRAHLATLDARKEKLNALRLRSLHYQNALGTDLTIALPEGHLWASGAGKTPAGQSFIANMPTEEIFTAPQKNGVNGVVYAAKPLVENGNIIEDFYFVVKDGRIEEFHAKRGEEFLRAALDADEGARYFGEVALVPYDSPISNQNLLYFNTLFDENASCHLAFGEAYGECLAGGTEMSREELQEHGLNYSIAHCDFMIGTRDLQITGETADGKTVEIFKGGNFAI